MTAAMRIAIVGPFFLPQIDGVEKVMLKHALHLAGRGHQVHVVTSRLRYPSGRFDDVPDHERHQGIEIHRLRVRVASPGWRFFYLNNGGVLIDGLGALLRRIDPEVLHAHQIAAPAWAHGAAWFAWRRGRKFFYSPHWHPDADPARWAYNSLLHGLNALPLRTARKVLHLTRLDIAPFGREYPFVPAQRMDVLPNGVDPPAPLARPPPDPARFDILFVGRVDEPRKGFDLLRAAFAQARQPHWRLVVLGRISEATRAALLAEFGEAVRVLGLVDEATLERAYAAADLFAMPSRYEGFGMPFIEAMRYGVPVLGTRVGGVPEVVPEGSGLLVPPDDAAALAGALSRLAEDAPLRARLGEAGRTWSENFHWRRIIDQLEAAYEAG